MKKYYENYSLFLFNDILEKTIKSLIIKIEEVIIFNEFNKNNIEYNNEDLSNLISNFKNNLENELFQLIFTKLQNNNLINYLEEVNLFKIQLKLYNNLSEIKHLRSEDNVNINIFENILSKIKKLNKNYELNNN